MWSVRRQSFIKLNYSLIVLIALLEEEIAKQTFLFGGERIGWYEFAARTRTYEKILVFKK